MDCFQVMQVFICIVELGVFGKVVDSLELLCVSVIQVIQ